MEEKKCPECGVVVPTCSCGIWDCGFYAHLRECNSERGRKYAKDVQDAIREREEWGKTARRSFGKWAQENDE